MEQLKAMKHSLMSCIQTQMGNLGAVDTKELGEAIDMVKDLSEAIYYCTVTEAMEGKEKEREPRYYRDMDRDWGRMYYNPSTSGTSYYSEREAMIPSMRDYREGRSPEYRKMYMEAKEMHADRAHAMKELEHYVQELTQDLVEMVKDASPEEKQFLEKRVAALAQKIGSTAN